MRRPGRAEDFPLIHQLWRSEARAGLRDFPTPRWLERVGAGFDWASRSRVVEEAGGIAGAVVVLDRELEDGVVARLELAGARDLHPELADWGARFSRAAGARSAQLWCRRGTAPALPEGGWRRIRHWLRMDHADPCAARSPEPSLPAGYRLASQDAAPQPVQAWVAAYNTAFREHWNFSPATAEEFASRYFETPDLLLMAADGEGRPAAFVWAQLEELDPEDPRPQPSGLLASVGTLPGHRRRGLASALCTEALRRLAGHGARSASLYVDGLNPTRAFDVYRRIGFRSGWESDVWELNLTKS